VEVSGTANADAVQGVDVVIVTVPFAGQAAIYKDIGPHLASGAIVCDTTSPLATAVGGRASWVLTPWQGSAAEQAEALLPEGIRLAAGFHSVSAEVLNDLGRALEGDVLLAGDDEAKAAVGALVERIPNLRWVDAGPLSSARLTERLTALLVNVNRRYKVKDAGIRIVGLPGRD